jgi:hypothetical protein
MSQNNDCYSASTAWTYNSAGLPATIQYPANNQGSLGEIVTTQYNNQMQPTSVLGNTFPHAYSYCQPANEMSANQDSKMSPEPE